MLDFWAFSRTNLLQEKGISDATETAIKRECNVILCDKGHVIPSFECQIFLSLWCWESFQTKKKDRDRVQSFNMEMKEGGEHDSDTSDVQADDIWSYNTDTGRYKHVLRTNT